MGNAPFELFAFGHWARSVVFDVLGRAVYTVTNANMNISTRLWSPGLYLLRLSKDGAAHLEKVVKA